MNLPVLCECNSFNCVALPINMSIEEQTAIKQGCPDYVVISNKCLNEPDPTDILVEKREEYSIYREG